MPAKTSQQWFADQLDFISEIGRRIADVRPDVSHAYHMHTALKLASLNHCLGVFLPIAKKYVEEGTFDSAVFIDLFAGCGATRVPETGDWLPGSPILAAGSKWAFDRIVCVERNREYCETLRSRLERFPDRQAVVLPGDCNEVARTLRRHVRSRNPLAFVFVDPEGMELKWDALRALSRQFPCMDLLLNLSYGAERVLADLRGGRDVNEGVMAAFAGPGWPMLLLETDKGVVDFVEERIGDVLGRPVGDRVLVRDSSNRPRYFLLVRVRRTGGGSQFFRGYEAMLNRVSGLKPQEIEGILNDKFGRSLWSFENGTEP